ncbi:hypothetical protein [Sanguibacter suaedae]|jgi:hypothetical protein|uniref:Carrier domain-containing protein n=1 Tax=Sanguibacter suaedae TaxID=2795737 RepID=A0A934MCV0_9MICO|nr:hypothetical protein [Sanguibacter suaedae]MBI9114194.1 hypothetical protein [Sanguibacter suaedae]
MIPTLEVLVEQMQAVSGAPSIDPDAPLVELSEIDSMDLMEWLFSFQSSHPDAGVDAAVFDNEDGSLTIRTVHERLERAVSADAVSER